MSSRKLEQITCACGHCFEAELWTSLSIADDPELKEALEAGEINVVCCPSCSEVFHVDHFLLYHDSKSELLVFVYPFSFSGQEQRLARKMNEDTDNALASLPEDQRFTYRPVLAFGLDELLHIIRREDEWEDELAIAEYLAEEFRFELVRLHPALARRHGLPRLLPRLPLPGKDTRSCILAGLRLLLQHNEHLAHFRGICERIEQEPGWDLSPDIVVTRR